jgi:hypothetical protein
MNGTWNLYNFLHILKYSMLSASLKFHNPEVNGMVFSTMGQGQQGARVLLGLRDPELITNRNTT